MRSITQPKNLFNFLRTHCSLYVSLSSLVTVMFSWTLNRRALNFFSGINFTFFLSVGTAFTCWCWFRNLFGLFWDVWKNLFCWSDSLPIRAFWLSAFSTFSLQITCFLVRCVVFGLLHCCALLFHCLHTERFRNISFWWAFPWPCFIFVWPLVKGRRFHCHD